MNNKELNDLIRKYCDDAEHYQVVPLTGCTGKVIPYIGWFWRSVNFEHIHLGFTGESYSGVHAYEFSKSVDFVGFMENNKWDYAEWTITGERAGKIKSLLEQAVLAPSNESFQAVYDFIQGTHVARP